MNHRRYQMQYFISLNNEWCPRRTAKIDLAFGRRSPHKYLAISQRRRFSVVGPSIWNDLPVDLRSLLAVRPAAKGFTSLLSSFSLVVAGLGALLSSFLSGRYINAQNE